VHVNIFIFMEFNNNGSPLMKTNGKRLSKRIKTVYDLISMTVIGIIVEAMVLVLHKKFWNNLVQMEDESCHESSGYDY
jgi:hypothetical protein